MNRYPRESVEFQPVEVTLDGEPITDGIEVSITTGTARPTVWQDAITVDDKTGFMVEGFAVGRYKVWVRVTSTPETPVIECGPGFAVG